MTEAYDKMKVILGKLHEIGAEALKELGEFPTNYTFFDSDGDLLFEFVEGTIGERIEEIGLWELVTARGGEVDPGKALHWLCVDLCRSILKAKEQIQFCAVTGEVWVTKGEVKDGKPVRENAQRWEAVHFAVHHRSGEMILACQDLLRPAGEHPSYFGELVVQDGADHGGEITRLFPSQLEKPINDTMEKFMEGIMNELKS